jgi:hypothetical protein
MSLDIEAVCRSDNELSSNEAFSGDIFLPTTLTTTMSLEISDQKRLSAHVTAMCFDYKGILIESIHKDNLCPFGDDTGGTGIIHSGKVNYLHPTFKSESTLQSAERERVFLNLRYLNRRVQVIVFVMSQNRFHSDAKSSGTASITTLAEDVQHSFEDNQCASVTLEHNDELLANFLVDSPPKKFELKTRQRSVNDSVILCVLYRKLIRHHGRGWFLKVLEEPAACLDDRKCTQRIHKHVQACLERTATHNTSGSLVRQITCNYSCLSWFIFLTCLNYGMGMLLIFLEDPWQIEQAMHHNSKMSIVHSQLSGGNLSGEELLAYVVEHAAYITPYESDWSLEDATLFSFTIMTTIGYRRQI